MTESTETNLRPVQARALLKVFRQTAQRSSKTRDQLTTGLGNLLLGEKEINESALEELETALLTTDVGLETRQAIMTELSDRETST